jgi:hypothetical protein
MWHRSFPRVLVIGVIVDLAAALHLSAPVGLASIPPVNDPGETMEPTAKGRVVELDGMKAAVPSSWKEERPANRLRFLQFRLPRVRHDKADAELIVFKGLGGTPLGTSSVPEISSFLRQARSSTTWPR